MAVKKAGSPANRERMSTRDEKESRSLRSRHRQDDDDDDDERPRRKRALDEEDDEVPRRRKSEGFDEKPAREGWKAVAKAREESNRNSYREFYLTEDNNTSIIQVCGEPLVVDTHSIKAKGSYKTLICQMEKQRHCGMCTEGEKVTTRSAIVVLDYRGSWDEKRNKFKWDEPVEKVWLMNATTAETMIAFIDKRGLDPSNCVLEVSRSGSGKKTVYTFTDARDKDDNKLKPIRHKVTLPPLRELLAPLSDEALSRYGY